MKPDQARKKRFFKVLRTILLFLAIGGGLFYAGYSFVLHQKAAALTPAQKQVQVIGHAGSGFLSPLNPFNPLPASSLTSILNALEEGADGVEVDIQLSRDGELILYHDERLESMTEATGQIEDLPARSVVGLPYKAGFIYDLFQDEKIERLETFLQKLKAKPDYPLLHLDLRNYKARHHDFYARTLINLLAKYNYPVQKLTYISSDPTLLQAFRLQQPQATFLIDRIGTVEQTLQSALDNQFHGMVANGNEMDETKMKKIREHQLLIVFFGPKSKTSILRQVMLQPDAIEVNNVPAMVKLVR